MSTYLGQNFLTDTSVLSRIVQTISKIVGDDSARMIVEIGPGKGALTKRIVSLGSPVLAIEKDETMSPILSALCEQHHNLQVRYQDILESDLSGLSSSSACIVGNLPYYITSPILRKFFEQEQAGRLGGVFLIQKEVAQKIMHDAPKKSFLRRLLNYAYDVQYCFSVPAKAFHPAPKVTSAVIALRPKSLSQLPSVSFARLKVFLDQYSPYKRKTLGASSKIIAKHHDILSSDHAYFHIDEYSHLRLEELGRVEMEQILA